MTLSEGLNITALVMIPIVSVLIGRWLQDRAEKRKDKLNIFKAVMTFRYGWSREGVEGLNLIPVVFSRKKRDKIVRDCWKEYYKYLCLQNPDEMQLKQRNNALFKLLESMANILGYNNVMTWEDIQNPYIPKGMVDSLNNNTIIQSGMANYLQGMIMNYQMSGHDQGENESKIDT